MTFGTRAGMAIPMQILLAVLPAVAAAAPPPDSGKAVALRQAAAVPMTWQVERQTGAHAGRKSCVVFSLGRDVIARLLEDPRTKLPAWSVLVGFDGQPGSVRYLRINRKFYQTDKPGFRGDEAAEIVARLKAPGEVVYEWAKRPDYAKRGGLFTTGDFAAKAADCEDWMSGTGI